MKNKIYDVISYLDNNMSNWIEDKLTCVIYRLFYKNIIALMIKDSVMNFKIIVCSEVII